MDIDHSQYGYIYQITNKINGKTYIGKHKTKRNERFSDYMGSGTALRRAISKYNLENFDKKIICYCSDAESLAKLELQIISREAAKGKAEYNISHGEQKRSYGSALVLENFNAIDLYLSQSYSINDLSELTGLSFATIHAYLNQFRNSDPRFVNIKQGMNRRKTEYTPERAKKLKETVLKNKVECKICKRKIGASVIDRHQNVCGQSSKCEICGVDLYRKTSTRCKIHFEIKDSAKKKLNKNFGDTVRQGGIVASHNRWHVNRGIVKSDCSLC